MTASSFSRVTVRVPWGAVLPSIWSRFCGPISVSEPCIPPRRRLCSALWTSATKVVQFVLSLGGWIELDRECNHTALARNLAGYGRVHTERFAVARVFDRQLNP